MQKGREQNCRREGKISAEGKIRQAQEAREELSRKEGKRMQKGREQKCRR